MGHMPVFSKGRLQYVDRLYGGDDFMSNYEAVLAVLTEQATIVAAAEQASTAFSTRLPAEDSAHFKNDWVGMWPDQPVDAILRHGWIKAFETARAANKPLEAFWIQGGEKVAVYISDGPRQVTVVMATPPVSAPAGARGPDPGMSVVHAAGRDEEHGGTEVGRHQGLPIVHTRLG